MATTCLLLPRAFLTNPTSKTHTNAQSIPKQLLQTTLHCQTTVHAHNSLIPSVGYAHNSSIPPIGLVRAVSEDDIPAISVGGITLQEQDKGSSSVGCKACGRQEIEKGCNGQGSIQGGIGTIPGFTWWPIKAYRPCPGFVASGGKYKRQGQSMDEVAFGRKGRDDDLNIKDRLKRP